MGNEDKLSDFANWAIKNGWYHIKDNKYLGEQWISPNGIIIWVRIDEDGLIVEEALEDQGS